MTRSRIPRVCLVVVAAVLTAAPVFAAGVIVVEGAPVETRADPACWPGENDAKRFWRYINCGNGTVLDTVTGLLWLRRANCLCPLPPLFCIDSGERNWFEAMEWVGRLEHGSCGLSDHSEPGDWRLPTADEWQATVKMARDLDCTTYGTGTPPTLTNDPGDDCLIAGPSSFSGVRTQFYWSSTPTSFSPLRYMIVYELHGGSRDGNDKGMDDFYINTDLGVNVWPVRDGR